MSIEGSVLRPAIYDLAEGQDLRELIEMAGGLLPEAHTGRAQVERIFAGDSLHVPQFQPLVVVEGAVNNPVAVAYRPGAGSGYYVDRAGGFSRSADRKRTYVVQPNGSVQKRNVDPEPGARVFVPAVPAGEEKTDWGAVLSSVASILTSALTIILVVQRL